MKNLTICVDFDGTCVKHKYPAIGEDIGAAPVLKRLVDEGAKLILWTMRGGTDLRDAKEWFAVNNIPLYGIQINPSQKYWTDSPKAYANIYIDDAALGAPLVSPNNGERPYIDWQKVEDFFFPHER